MKASAGKILMLLESYLLGDPRVRKEAFRLRNAGYSVRVISLKESRDKKIRENVEGIICYRIPHISLFKKSNISKSAIQIIFYRLSSVFGYIFEYFYFTTACFLITPYVAIRDGFDVIHVHNPPNTLSLVAIFYKFFGKRFVFDHHDLEPELFLSRYGLKASLISRFLFVLEKICIRFADLVIATNNSYKEIEVQRGGIQPDKIFVVRNGPEPHVLYPIQPDRQLQKMNKSILVYVGEMSPQDGVDYLLRSLWHLVNTLGRTDFYCVIVGPGDSLSDLKTLLHELDLKHFVRFTGFIPKVDLVRYLSTADICVDPNPSNPLNDHSTWIKVMEYMAMGKPIVSFDLKETRFTAQEAAIYVKPNDEKAYAEAILKLMDNPSLRERKGRFGMQRIKSDLAWEIVSENLMSAYRWLLGRTKNPIIATYYSIRPFLPRWIQILARRKRVANQKKKYSKVWPINIKAATTPDGWKGWPDGKKFALVLTHDVESSRGVERVPELIKLEKSAGFKSSFNFVPKRYCVSDTTRNLVVSAGFEVGVHGLLHDGKLYRNKSIFDERAEQINGYLQKWGASGFRSPAMHHNLDWIQGLNMDYDSSTFDTDPFEPQPDGLCTIFPVWVKNTNDSHRRGYVELPCTLPQDLTLFVLMKEKSIDIWKRKLDWIVEKGGLALINTHPDYMHFGSKSARIDEYLVDYYRLFLSYINSTYGDSCWHVLPKEIAAYWKNKYLL